MRKIGIISLFGRFNFGNRLQNYATCRICEHEGFSAESLVLGKRFSLRRAVKQRAKNLLGRPEPLRLEERMDPLRLAAFDRFNELISVRYVERADHKLGSEYAYFVVGSDQVWNPRFFAYNEDWFFLRFAERSQRIALAPSIGANKLTPFQGAVIAHGVKGFSNLSIREEQGAELISKYAGVEAAVICDPTLVIPAEEWLLIADDRLTPNKPYIFTYLLGDGSIPRNILSKVSEDGRIPVIALTDRDGSGELPVGPSEFLSLIASAAHVVTDSFHAALFSAVFQVPLTVVRRTGGSEMFSRIETLAKKLGIENKVYGAPSFDLSKASDYGGVSDAISREREIFMRFFRESFDA